MKTKLFSAALAALVSATPVMAELTFAALSYRTGPYANNGIPFADGYTDYFTLLQERDGGIGGESINFIECETGYNTEKGVECYESTKSQGVLAYAPLSTGITYQLIPKATADGIAVHSMGYGRTSAKNGEVFRNIFNFPANYWDGASVAIKHLLDVNGGDISGKKVALVYHNSAYGKEPIRTLEVLAEKHGYELSLLPVDHPGQEQKSQWLQIRRDRPDYVLMWGWGVMNQVAIQEAANIRFPMENFIGVWWSGSENDVLPAGAKANGYKAITFHNVGSNFPVFDDIQKYVVATGKAAGAGDNIGTALYNRGMYNAMLLSEAAKTAQAITGKSAISQADMIKGMEALEMTEEKMAALGLPNFGPSFSVSCQNHGGDGLVAVAQWDAGAGSWSIVSDYQNSDMGVLQPLIDADSSAFASENNITPNCN
jgi:branched-chain amino acid transport system substrate-binding protein